MKIKLLIFALLLSIGAKAQFTNFNPYGVQKANSGDSLRLVGSTTGQYLNLPTTKMLRSAILANSYSSGYGLSLNGQQFRVKSEGVRLDSAYTYILGWGDSLTEGAGGVPYPTALHNMTYFTVINKGVGGETSTQIKNRFIADTANYNKSVIIWVGRNNLLSPNTVRSDINTIVSALGHKRYLVLSILNGADEPKGSSIYNSIISLNNNIKADHPNNYLDIRSYLANLFPNAQDIIDPSLRLDALHLNTLGNQKTAEFLNSNLGTLLNNDSFLQSKDFKYYSNYYNNLSGFGTNGQVAFFNGSKNISGSIGLIYDNVNYSLGLATSPISIGDPGTGWYSTGAPVDAEYGGGLISSIAGINQAYFYSSQLYAIVKGGVNVFSQPIGVKLQVNDGQDALIAESDKKITLPYLSGSGNRLIKSDNTGSLSNSIVSDNGTGIAISGDLGLLAGTGIKINNTNSGGYSELVFDNDMPSVGGGFVFGYGGSASGVPNTAYLFQRKNAPILIGTNNSERMSIQASGEIKINNLSGALGGSVLAGTDGTLSRGTPLIANNDYAFKSLLTSIAGLKFNATNGRYDFINTSGAVSGSIDAIGTGVSTSGKMNAGTAPTTANDVVRLTDLGTGWANYADNVYTSASPFTITSGSTSTLPNNAATVLNSQIPIGVTSFYNSATSKITPQNDGDYYVATIRFKGKTTAPTAGYLDFGIDIGGALGLQFKETKIFAKGAGIEHNFSIVVPMYTAATFLANGGLVKLTAGNGDMTVYDISYQIDRTHKAK